MTFWDDNLNPITMLPLSTRRVGPDRYGGYHSPSASICDREGLDPRCYSHNRDHINPSVLNTENIYGSSGEVAEVLKVDWKIDPPGAKLMQHIDYDHKPFGRIIKRINIRQY